MAKEKLGAQTKQPPGNEDKRQTQRITTNPASTELATSQAVAHQTIIPKGNPDSLNRTSQANLKKTHDIPTLHSKEFRRVD